MPVVLCWQGVSRGNAILLSWLVREVESHEELGGCSEALVMMLATLGWFATGLGQWVRSLLLHVMLGLGC